MQPRDYIEQYIDRLGGPVEASKRLGIPYPTIAAVRNGTRGIGKRLAVRMAAADPDLDPSVLVWVRSAPAQGDSRA